MSVTIYHNPSCGTSRNTLAMIRQSGEEPEVIEYLRNPPSRARSGGFLRYSMISGSSPLCRIIASVLREVPQAGLW